MVGTDKALRIAGGIEFPTFHQGLFRRQRRALGAQPDIIDFKILISCIQSGNCIIAQDGNGFVFEPRNIICGNPPTIRLNRVGRRKIQHVHAVDRQPQECACRAERDRVIIGIEHPLAHCAFVPGIGPRRKVGWIEDDLRVTVQDGSRCNHDLGSGNGIAHIQSVHSVRNPPLGIPDGVEFICEFRFRARCRRQRIRFHHNRSKILIGVVTEYQLYSGQVCHSIRAILQHLLIKHRHPINHDGCGVVIRAGRVFIKGELHRHILVCRHIRTVPLRAVRKVSGPAAQLTLRRPVVWAVAIARCGIRVPPVGLRGESHGLPIQRAIGHGGYLDHIDRCVIHQVERRQVDQQTGITAVCRNKLSAGFRCVLVQCRNPCSRKLRSIEVIRINHPCMNTAAHSHGCHETDHQPYTASSLHLTLSC